jgi:tetratricopeptide (TPR) repeat protein
MKRAAFLCIAVMALACALPGRGDPFKEGRDLYKAGRYGEAATKLEEAVRTDPKNAKAWWQLNFASNKLQRYADALKAAEQAGAVDPTYSFASSRAKYTETVQRLRKKAGQRSRSGVEYVPSAVLGPLSGPDGSMSQQLTSRGVFVQHGITVDVERLRRVIRELEPVPVRFLVFSSRAGSAALSKEADRVRRYLGLRDGYVIACSRAGVAVSSEKLSTSKLRELTRQAAVRMEAGDYTGALEKLARDLVATRSRQSSVQKTAGITIISVAVGGVAIWVVGRRMRRARSMKARRATLEQRKSEVISEMNYLEDSAAAIPAAAATIAQQARQEAGEKLDEAARIMVKARDEYDLSSAQDLLDSAAAIVHNGRAVVDGALTGKSFPSTPQTAGVPPVYPEAVASGSDTKWDEVPENERGVCFFCSRPSLLSELTPVTIELDGRQQKVLACPEDYRSIREGRPAQIRAFERDGRYVPWYAEPDYDPYRDYYGRGYGTGDMVRDLVMLNLIDRMFWDWSRPSWGWGWGGGHGAGWDGYTFWPDHPYYHDYHAERAAEGADFTDDFGRHAAGTDFLDGGGGTDSSSAAGADFLGSDQS